MYVLSQEFQTHARAIYMCPTKEIKGSLCKLLSFFFILFMCLQLLHAITYRKMFTLSDCISLDFSYLHVIQIHTFQCFN